MNADEVEALIEDRVPDAEATVTTPRDPGGAERSEGAQNGRTGNGVTRESDDDKHYAVDVVSPAFEGETLVDQHQLVHDALGEHLTRDIHAIELTTNTPDDGE